ncbi:hypothetical protein HPP92_006034 [Vanilla planifolia]|uniref:Homeobox domain-containing protein n=1 Tax=Vanilla planifolia TaxID=51239 RepID=A0A835RI97_VANPL|nr:hypothetical protein HPP92_006034 [Vanilla planifolia]
MENCCDTGLSLGLGIGGRPTTLRCPPSLTLTLSDELHGSSTTTAAAVRKKVHNPAARPARLSSPPSAVSSFSTTNANPGGGGRPEADSERAPSRASDEDDDAVAARKKLRLTKEQSALLEDRFKEHSTLNPKQKQSLAKQLNLRPRQVEVWFQNRRARTKLKQTEMDCEYLKKCCDALTEENRRLQRELHDLRALKFTTSASQPLPLFMQLPAPALTLCPSCERISGDGAGFVRGSKPQPPPPPPPPSAPHFFNPFAHSAAC